MEDTIEVSNNRFHRPIFVMGCCNSGTSVLWRALQKHPEICSPPVEGQDLANMPEPMTHFLGKHTFRMWAHYLHEQPIVKGTEDSPGSRLPYYFSEKDWNKEYQKQIEEAYLPYLKQNKRLCDKSPAHTLRARFIQRCFPDSTFIGIVRNGYAVSEGIVRKRRYDPERPSFEGLHTEISDAAWQWKKSNEVLISQMHFLKNYKIVRYEDLVSDPEDTLNSVLDFCQLEKNGFQIPSFDKTKNTEQISRLTTEDIAQITRIAEPILSYFGYEILSDAVKKELESLTYCFPV